MADRTPTTKGRAKRIALDYFKRPHPFRSAKLLLSIALPLVAAGWLIVAAVRGDQRLYSSGPVSAAHTMFGARCGDCHAAAAGAAAAGFTPRAAFFVPVSDRTCSVCHEGPVHHGSQAFTPACSSCHFEHKSRTRLVDLGDRQCTQCHVSLETKEGHGPAFAAKIADFQSGHPEFAVNVVRDGRRARARLDDKAAPRDAAQIKLNHAVHLKAGLKGLDDVKARTGKLGLIERDGKPALNCTYCHRLDAHRVSIEPVSFTRHCTACHPLDVDARLADAVAPHDTPALVHAYLRTTLTEAFEQCQAPANAGVATPTLRKQCDDLGLAVAAAEKSQAPPRPETATERRPEPESDAPRGRRLGRTAPAEEPEPEAPRGRRLGRTAPAEEPEPERPRRLRGSGDEPATTPAAPAPSASALQWTVEQLPGVEKVMFRQKCGFCHVLSQAGVALPEIAPTAIPARWLPHSVFDHGVHRSLTCTECHGKAAKSTETTDVLLPSVSVCRECHRAKGGARAACVECHLYHDKTKDRDPDGPLTVQRLVRGRTR